MIGSANAERLTMEDKSVAIAIFMSCFQFNPDFGGLYRTSLALQCRSVGLTLVEILVL